MHLALGIGQAIRIKNMIECAKYYRKRAKPMEQQVDSCTWFQLPMRICSGQGKVPQKFYDLKMGDLIRQCCQSDLSIDFHPFF